MSVKGVGLYIGAKTICIAQVENRSGKAILEKLAVVPTPAEAIDQGDVVDSKPIVSVLKSLWEEKGFEQRRIGFAMPAHEVIIRLTSLPKMSDVEIYEALRTEVEGYAAIAGSEPVLDWIKLPGNSDGNINNIDLLFAATPAENVYQYISILKDAGVRTNFVDVFSLAATKAFTTPETFDTEFPNNIVVTTDSDNTMALAFRNGYPSSSHIIEVGSEEGTDIIEDLAYELELYCNFYRTDYPDEDISQILFAMDSPEYERTIEKLRQETGENFVKINPLANIDEIACDTGIVDKHVLSCATAIGLALREAKFKLSEIEFNLTPRSILTKTQLRKQMLRVGAIAAVIALLGVAGGVGIDWMTNSKRAEIQALRAQMAQLDQNSLKQVEKYQSDMKQFRESIDKYNEIVASIKSQREYYVLDYVRKVIPKDSWLSLVRCDEDDIITLNGYSFSEDSVFLFADMLRDLSADGQVKISMQREQSLVHFHMQFERGET